MPPSEEALLRLRDPGTLSPMPANAYAEGVAHTAGLGRARRTLPIALIATLRPRQWLKNLLVFAAAGAAGVLGDDEIPPRIAMAFIAFCMLASAIYAINDVRDAEEDRLHPRKRFRPVAAGELKPAQALTLAGGLIVAGLGLCLALSPLLALVGAGYLALTLSYTVLWRYVPLLDIAAIAGGFVLRAVAGGVAAPVPLSRWFLLVITFAAGFIAAGKRQSEQRRTVRDGGTRRTVLAHYDARVLRLIVLGCIAGSVFAYCMWAFALPLVDGVPWRPLTILPFAGCLLRYWALIEAGKAEAPEDALLGDRVLLLLGLLWLVLFGLAVHDTT